MTDKELFQISIGKRIKAFRELKEFTLQELAAACDMEKSNLSRLEHGGTNPTLYTLKKICNKLDVTLSELVNL